MASFLFPRDDLSPDLIAQPAGPMAHLVGESARRRRRERPAIWDLPSTCHCVTIGTCLTLPELRRVAVRLGLFQGADHMTDYELHGAFVHAMDVRNRASAAVQKLLEAKHAGMVRRAERCADETALEGLWDEAVSEGLVPGAFWALITHPALPPTLEKRIFGEVHMMSHLCGASHRGDARAIATIDRQRRELARRLAVIGAEHREALVRRDDEIARLKRLVVALEPHIHAADALRRTCEALRARPDAAASDAAAAALKEARETAERLERDCEALRARAVAAEARAEILADRLSAMVAPARPAGGCDAACPLNLAGRRVAYIGGRPQTVARIRTLVERCNGCLLAHDGGCEQSAQVLDGILAQADVVVVPVDCVSHGAMEKARLACERGAATFAPIASSSFSAFAALLGDLDASGQAPADA